MQLTLDNTFEIHEDWLLTIRRILNKRYKDVRYFSHYHGIDYLSSFWFLKGNPVRKDTFEIICKSLGINSQIIQQPLKIKLLKLHCTYAGFIRAGLKKIETRKTSSAIGRNYRDWVAIAASHSPKKPDWRIVKQVAELAALKDPQWLNVLDNPSLYKAGHILVLARIADVWQMTEDNITDSALERLVGDWQPGRWAIELESAIALDNPIPYKIDAQGAIYLTPEHHVYDQLVELLLYSA